MLGVFFIRLDHNGFGNFSISNSSKVDVSMREIDWDLDKGLNCEEFNFFTRIVGVNLSTFRDHTLITSGFYP